MRWHHLGRQAGARLHLGQFALGFGQRGVGRLKLAVGGGKLFRAA